MLQWGRGLSPRIGPERLHQGATCGPASMGPRSVTADRPRPRNYPRPSRASFNGAAVCHRGSEAAPAGRCRAAGRFNGAAVCHRGSVPVVQPVRVRVKVASMGPRSVTADRLAYLLTLVGKDGFASMGPRSVTADRRWSAVFLSKMPSPLQWGRGLSPRIGSCCSCSRADTSLASMGPRSVTADRQREVCECP